MKVVVQDDGSDSDGPDMDFGQLEELDDFQKMGRKKKSQTGKLKVIEKEVKYKGEKRSVPEEYETSKDPDSK